MFNSRAIDQHIFQLGKRIEVDQKNPSIIQTVHGEGDRSEAKEVFIQAPFQVFLIHLLNLKSQILITK